jgi:hypothetical protein
LSVGIGLLIIDSFTSTSVPRRHTLKVPFSCELYISHYVAVDEGRMHAHDRGVTDARRR